MRRVGVFVLFVACRLMPVVRCVTFAICCVLFAAFVWCFLFTALCVECCLLVVVLSAVCCLLFVGMCMCC